MFFNCIVNGLVSFVYWMTSFKSSTIKSFTKNGHLIAFVNYFSNSIR